MINNSLNVPTGAPPARVSTPPSNPASMTSSSGHDVTGSVGNTTTTSSRGDTAAISMSSGGVGGTYNANAYFQTAASAAAADASIFRMFNRLFLVIQNYLIGFLTGLFQDIFRLLNCGRNVGMP